MFKKSSGDSKQGGAVSAAIRGGGAEGGSISIIGPGMRIEGDVVTDGTVRVEGSIHGTLRAARAVVIGKEGEVVGELSAEEAVIGGRVRGTISAPGRIQLQATCDVEGEVHAGSGHFVLEEGGRFTGQVRMDGTRPGGLDNAPRALPAAASSGENSA